jgi:hypothetical protein
MSGQVWRGPAHTAELTADMLDITKWAAVLEQGDSLAFRPTFFSPLSSQKECAQLTIANLRVCMEADFPTLINRDNPIFSTNLVMTMRLLLFAEAVHSVLGLFYTQLAQRDIPVQTAWWRNNGSTLLNCYTHNAMFCHSSIAKKYLLDAFTSLILCLKGTPEEAERLGLVEMFFQGLKEKVFLWHVEQESAPMMLASPDIAKPFLDFLTLLSGQEKRQLLPGFFDAYFAFLESIQSVAPQRILIVLALSPVFKAVLCLPELFLEALDCLHVSAVHPQWTGWSRFWVGAAYIIQFRDMVLSYRQCDQGNAQRMFTDAFKKYPLRAFALSVLILETIQSDLQKNNPTYPASHERLIQNLQRHAPPASGRAEDARCMIISSVLSMASLAIDLLPPKEEKDSLSARKKLFSILSFFTSKQCLCLNHQEKETLLQKFLLTLQIDGMHCPRGAPVSTWFIEQAFNTADQDVHVLPEDVRKDIDHLVSEGLMEEGSLFQDAFDLALGMQQTSGMIAFQHFAYALWNKAVLYPIDKRPTEGLSSRGKALWETAIFEALGPQTEPFITYAQGMWHRPPHTGPAQPVIEYLFWMHKKYLFRYPPLASVKQRSLTPYVFEALEKKDFPFLRELFEHLVFAARPATQKEIIDSILRHYTESYSCDPRFLERCSALVFFQELLHVYQQAFSRELSSLCDALHAFLRNSQNDWLALFYSKDRGDTQEALRRTIILQTLSCTLQREYPLFSEQVYQHPLLIFGLFTEIVNTTDNERMVVLYNTVQAMPRGYGQALMFDALCAVIFHPSIAWKDDKLLLQIVDDWMDTRLSLQGCSEDPPPAFFDVDGKKIYDALCDWMTARYQNVPVWVNREHHLRFAKHFCILDAQYGLGSEAPVIGETGSAHKGKSDRAFSYCLGLYARDSCAAVSHTLQALSVCSAEVFVSFASCALGCSYFLDYCSQHQREQRWLGQLSSRDREQIMRSLQDALCVYLMDLTDKKGQFLALSLLFKTCHLFAMRRDSFFVFLQEEEAIMSRMPLGLIVLFAFQNDSLPVAGYIDFLAEHGLLREEPRLKSVPREYGVSFDGQQKEMEWEVWVQVVQKLISQALRKESTEKASLVLVPYPDLVFQPIPALQALSTTDYESIRLLFEQKSSPPLQGFLGFVFRKEESQYPVIIMRSHAVLNEIEAFAAWMHDRGSAPKALSGVFQVSVSMDMSEIRVIFKVLKGCTVKEDFEQALRQIPDHYESYQRNGEKRRPWAKQEKNAPRRTHQSSVAVEKPIGETLPVGDASRGWQEEKDKLCALFCQMSGRDYPASLRIDFVSNGKVRNNALVFLAASQMDQPFKVMIMVGTEKREIVLLMQTYFAYLAACCNQVVQQYDHAFKNGIYFSVPREDLQSIDFSDVVDQVRDRILSEEQERIAKDQKEKEGDLSGIAVLRGGPVSPVLFSSQTSQRKEECCSPLLIDKVREGLAWCCKGGLASSVAAFCASTDRNSLRDCLDGFVLIRTLREHGYSEMRSLMLLKAFTMEEQKRKDVLSAMVQSLTVLRTIWRHGEQYGVSKEEAIGVFRRLCASKGEGLYPSWLGDLSLCVCVDGTDKEAVSHDIALYCLLIAEQCEGTRSFHAEGDSVLYILYAVCELKSLFSGLEEEEKRRIPTGLRHFVQYYSAAWGHEGESDVKKELVTYLAETSNRGELLSMCRLQRPHEYASLLR